MSNDLAPVKTADPPARTALPMHTDTEQHTLRISYQSSHDFETTRARLDEQLPLLDPLVSLDLVLRDASWAEVESTVATHLGPTGFVALARHLGGYLRRRFSRAGAPPLDPAGA